MTESTHFGRNIVTDFAFLQAAAPRMMAFYYGSSPVLLFTIGQMDSDRELAFVTVPELSRPRPE